MNNPKRILTRWFLFACIGLLIEVFFTGILHFIGGDRSAMSKTSPWMMIDYGMLGVVIWPIKEALEKRGVPLAGRAFVYMLGIFVIEYVSGIAFNMAGIHIWDYSNHAIPLGGRSIPMHLHGQITAFYAPLWYALGFVLEWLHRRVDAVAVLLLTGKAQVA
ncbi:MAG: hypothetical protein GC168_12645 [Candidatus Hydrogenedens sp.]|nr:hypothetical protein [Candidatus Hydrogenedens sp.]